MVVLQVKTGGRLHHVLKRKLCV